MRDGLNAIGLARTVESRERTFALARSSGAERSLRRRRQAIGFACVLCNGASASASYEDNGWSVVRCNGCGLLATWPIPDDATLERLYESPIYFDARAMAVDAAEGWHARAREILRLLPSVDGPALDFGAGSGHFVFSARTLGFAMDGLEPSARARALARELYGLELLSALPASVDRPYAAVTMIHVLEHLRNPVQELEALRPLLKRDGAIFIEVPHAGSVEMRIPSRRRPILDLPAHLHHFTPGTLKQVLRTAGYEVVDIRLFNSPFVERVLSLHAGDTSRGETSPDLASVGQPAAGATRDRRRIFTGLLRTARLIWPGGKFQVIAQRVR